MHSVKKIAVAGLGVWGFCLARLLAQNGHKVQAWARESALLKHLAAGNPHPKLNKASDSKNISFHADLAEALNGAELIVESVTAAGLKELLTNICKIQASRAQPTTLGKTKGIGIILTSKGIEPNEEKFLPLLSEEMLGHDRVALLSGPSFAWEVADNLPTAVVMGSKNLEFATMAANCFGNNFFRVYPNQDVIGIALGGALKNVVAIACGIADGLKLGYGAKAALMTRGLHEITRLAPQYGCQEKTLYGLSGMGDTFLTCSSSFSRNFRFGRLLAEGKTPQEAKEEIGMVVEGASTCISAVHMARKHAVVMPICESVQEILVERLTPKDAVLRLMQRIVREEHL